MTTLSDTEIESALQAAQSKANRAQSGHAAIAEAQIATAKVLLLILEELRARRTGA